jgi:hypothetical protein
MLTGGMGYAAVLGLIALVSTACNNRSETDIKLCAAGIWQLLLWTSRGHVNRQFDVGHEGHRCQNYRRLFHHQIVNVADWNSPQVKTAYPGSSLGSNPSDNATLVMTGDHWAYTK